MDNFLDLIKRGNFDYAKMNWTFYVPFFDWDNDVLDIHLFFNNYHTTTITAGKIFLYPYNIEINTREAIKIYRLFKNN